LGGHSDTRVSYLTSQRHGVNSLVDHADMQSHLAPLGKFDGIANEIREYLTQPERVAAECGRNACLNIGSKLEPLVRVPTCDLNDQGSGYEKGEGSKYTQTSGGQRVSASEGLHAHHRHRGMQRRRSPGYQHKEPSQGEWMTGIVGLRQQRCRPKSVADECDDETRADKEIGQ